MKGTVTRLRLLSLAAVVLVIAASIAVAAAPRRASHTAAPQPVSVAQVQSLAPAAPVAHATQAKPVQVAHVVAAPVAPASETLVPVRASAGMLIVKDPETGMIGLDPSSSMIGNELNDSDEGLVEETAWDGSKMVNLQGRFQEVFVMRMSPDGKRWIECAQKPSAHAAPVAAPAPVPQFEER